MTWNETVNGPHVLCIPADPKGQGSWQRSPAPDMKRERALDSPAARDVTSWRGVWSTLWKGRRCEKRWRELTTVRTTPAARGVQGAQREEEHRGCSPSEGHLCPSGGPPGDGRRPAAYILLRLRAHRVRGGGSPDSYVSKHRNNGTPCTLTAKLKHTELDYLKASGAPNERCIFKHLQFHILPKKGP